MTATTPTRPDFAGLDQRIAQGLVTLRLARIAARHSTNQETTCAEQNAEALLNALLECRYAAQQR